MLRLSGRGGMRPECGPAGAAAVVAIVLLLLCDSCMLGLRYKLARMQQKRRKAKVTLKESAKMMSHLPLPLRAPSAPSFTRIGICITRDLHLGSGGPNASRHSKLLITRLLSDTPLRTAGHVSHLTHCAPQPF